MGSNSYSTGFFGKLPVFADFINFNASGREARALHQWFQEGLYACRNKLSSWPDEFYQMPRYNFLFNAGSMESFIIGCFGPGEDQSGRKYPFVVFSIIVQKSLGRTIADIPILFPGFLLEAYSLINGGWMSMDAKSLAAWAQNTTASPVAQDIQSELSSLTIENLISDVLGEFHDDRKYLICQNIIDLLSPLRNQNTQRFTLGLRFPLSSKKQQWALESILWLNLLFKYLGRAQMEPVFFLNADITNFSPYLFIYLRPPSPKHFTHLVQPNIESELVCNLDDEGIGRISEIKNKMNPRLISWLDTASLSLADFIDNFSSI